MYYILRHAYLVGCYYQPGTNLDDILVDLATALNRAPSGLPILIGGDLNLSHTSFDFEEILDFLRSYDLDLLSDLDVTTFSNHNSSSRNDYTFCSKSAFGAKEIVIQDIVCSDHFPVSIIVKLNKNNSVINSHNQEVKPTFLHVDECVRMLSDPGLLELDAEEIPDKIDSILAAAIRPKKNRRKSTKPWFTAYSHSLRKSCQFLRRAANMNPNARKDFSLARTAYHRHLRSAKQEYEDNEVVKLIAKGRKDGLKAVLESPKEREGLST